MSEALLEMPVVAPPMTRTPPTPFYGPSIDSQFAARQAPSAGWDRQLVSFVPNLPERTRTLSLAEVQAGEREREQWITLFGLAATLIYLLLRTPVTPADARETISSPTSGRIDWWNRQDIGPEGLDLVALPPSGPARPLRSSALAAADDLRDWLDITYDDLARMTGVGRTTFYDWKRENRAPRPATTQRLRRLHGLVRAIRAELGFSEAADWFRTGTPAPIDLLLAGNYEGVERLAQQILFRQPYQRGPNFAAYAPYDPETDIDLRPPEGSEYIKKLPQARRIRLTRK
jgi:hypothetical protein